MREEFYKFVSILSPEGEEIRHELYVSRKKIVMPTLPSGTAGRIFEYHVEIIKELSSNHNTEVRLESKVFTKQEGDL